MVCLAILFLLEKYMFNISMFKTLHMALFSKCEFIYTIPLSKWCFKAAPGGITNGVIYHLRFL